MRNLYSFLLALAVLASTNFCFAGNPENSFDPNEVTYVKPGDDQLTPHVQARLRQMPAWQNFLVANGNWYVHFDENSQQPHRAFGEPISTSGSTPEQQALNFIESNLAEFNLPVDELVVASSSSSKKHHWVNFSQFHNGYEVFAGRLTVKLTHTGEVILFGLDVHNNIATDPATVSAAQAEALASAGLSTTVISTESNGPQQILPVPKNGTYEFHIVHDIMVKTLNENGIPSNYRTLVDASTGEILYRQDTVHHHSDRCKEKHGHGHPEAESSMAADADVDVVGTIHPENPYNGTEEVSLGDLSVFLGAQEFFTEAQGGVSLTASSGTITVPLSGRWSVVSNNGVTPETTFSLQDGTNEVSFDDDADIKELTAFYHTNVVHNFMKTVFPDFTALDFALPTNVEVAGECNAFFDGQSINFFTAGGGCNATSLLSDVVYHEYGHGINSYYYNDNGFGFNNGAMNEGYADFWGMAITGSPLLGVGFYEDSEDPLRRYDINPKVYPEDLIGQVHNDGEIICGAWWDSHVLMGEDWELTLDLWVEAFNGFQATLPNGMEGTAYTDVLIDVLQADDDDNDISNGTPNGDAILEGFAIHGITLLSNVDLSHEQVLTSEPEEEIEIIADLDSDFDFEMFLQEVTLFYKTDTESQYSAVTMSEIGETSTFTATIPSQEEGTLIEYYLQTEDVYGNQSNATPIGVTLNDPTLPFYTLVGFGVIGSHDSDFSDDFGIWETGIFNDNATTGNWEEIFPIGSFTENNNQVAPNSQFTDDGTYCFVTENASSQFDAIGTADVDGGKTTLRTPLIDMSIYEKPAISYWRWYTNSPPSGANPGQDWWEVRISDDGGNTWTHVEETRTTDAEWRQNAFIVSEYVDLTEEVMMEFVASDSIFPNLELEGGSLVEAAVDDFYVYEKQSNVSVEENEANFGMVVYPNPAAEQVFVTISTKTQAEGELVLVNLLGEQVFSQTVSNQAGNTTFEIPTSNLSSGVYLVKMKTDSGVKTRKLTVR